MSPQPSRTDLSAIDRALRSIEPECRAAASASRKRPGKPNKDAEADAVAQAYRNAGLVVCDAGLFDLEAQRFAGFGPCVPILVYRDLDIEFQRARDFGARLGGRVKSMRRALWVAASTAAAGWGWLAIHFMRSHA
jgi:hypothetical protein